jgi:Ca2+-binding EF-hand superfamily protein
MERCSGKPPRKIKDPELAMAVQKIGQAFGRKHGKILKAWRSLDDDKSGEVERSEVQKLFRNNGMDEEMGDRFFDYINSEQNTEGAETIDYGEFQSYFMPYLYGWSTLGKELSLENSKAFYEDKCHKLVKEASRKKKAAAEGPPIERSETEMASAGPEVAPEVTRKLFKHEMDSIIDHVARQTAEHNHSVRKAWQAFQYYPGGASSDGKHIDKSKFREYVSQFGYDAWTADQVFERIDTDGSGHLDYQEFQEVFGDYIMPSWIVQKSTKKRELPQPGKPLRDRRMRDIVANIGVQLANRHLHPFDAFKALDHNGNGVLDKNIVRSFFGQFEYPKEVADEFYNKHLKRDEEGLVDYLEFTSHFCAYMKQGFESDEVRAKNEALSARPESRFLYAGTKELDNLEDQDFARCLRRVGENAARKFSSIRKAWRTIDPHKHGAINKDEMAVFFDRMGYNDRRIVDKLFAIAELDGEDNITYLEFQKYFAPVISGNSALGAERQISENKTFAERLVSANCHGEKCKKSESRFSENCLLQNRSSSVPASARELRQRSKADDATEKRREKSVEASAEHRAYAKSPKVSDRELSRVVTGISEKMRARYGDRLHQAFKGFASRDKEYVTKGDVQKIFKDYGYADVAGQFFDRLDGDGTGAVSYNSFETLFSKQRENPNGMSQAKHHIGLHLEPEVNKHQ